MIAAALQVIPQTWPHLLHPHPWAVICFVVGGGILFAYGAFSHEKPKGHSIKGGQGVIGHQIVAGGDVHIHPAAPPPPPPPPEYPVIQTYSPPPPPPLRLDFSLERLSLIYRVELSAWRETTQFEHDGRTAIVGWFRNPVPPKGTRGVDASHLSAHIRYSVEGHWSTEVSRAYWLRYSENEITINIADRAGLIIGFAEGSNWVSYLNPFANSADEGILQPAFRHPGHKEQMPAADMNIEISLLSRGTTTLDQQKVRLVFTNGRPFAVRFHEA